ncbi:MAG: dihydrofolate reductase [Asticcacaulis sp.]|nr:dihydrofolate reductase [Asticcacaulis sp.]
MSRLRVSCFSLSLDGFGAGPDQSLDQPLGIGGKDLHKWIFPTRSFQDMHGGGGGDAAGADEDFARRGMANLGAWIMGRNMFGPVRGEWPDEAWKGWWGDNPPYHTDVFVLTHYARRPIEMDGGTVFHFVTGGIHEALDRARRSAGGKDIRFGGGAATIRDYLHAGLVDEMHLAYAPVMLGRGESLLQGIDLPAMGFRVIEQASTPNATHVVLGRQ